MWTLNCNSTWAVTDDVSQVHKNTSTDKNAYWETAIVFKITRNFETGVLELVGATLLDSGPPGVEFDTCGLNLKESYHGISNFNLSFEIRVKIPHQPNGLFGTSATFLTSHRWTYWHRIIYIYKSVIAVWY